MSLASANYSHPDFGDLVAGIRNNDPTAVEQLYHFFQKGLRWYIARKGFHDSEDLAQDVFLVTIAAIQRGDLREPERLAGFIRGVARNLVSEAISALVRSRTLNRAVLGHPVLDYDRLEYHKERTFEERYYAATSIPNAEQSLLERERKHMMVQALNKLRPKQREILERFYLQEQPCEQICDEMHLTGNQYRLLKSRAKTYLTTVVRRHSAQANVAVQCRQVQRRALSCA